MLLATLTWPTSVDPAWTHGAPPGEYPWIGLLSAMAAAAVWAGHRARVDLTGTTLTITGPWGATTIHTDEVTAVAPGPWGAQMHRTGHRPLAAFAVQGTRLSFRHRPRWVDVAQPVTGVEPAWRVEADEADEG